MELDGGEKRTSWAGADAEIDKQRPKSILNQQWFGNPVFGDLRLCDELAMFDRLLNSLSGDQPAIGE